MNRIKHLLPGGELEFVPLEEVLQRAAPPASLMSEAFRRYGDQRQQAGFEAGREYERSQLAGEIADARQDGYTIGVQDAGEKYEWANRCREWAALVCGAVVGLVISAAVAAVVAWTPSN